jgi:hypothetical protein
MNSFNAKVQKNKGAKFLMDGNFSSPLRGFAALH